MELQELIDILETLKSQTPKTKVFIATSPWVNHQVNGCYFDDNNNKIFIH